MRRIVTDDNQRNETEPSGENGTQSGKEPAKSRRGAAARGGEGAGRRTGRSTAGAAKSPTKKGASKKRAAKKPAGRKRGAAKPAERASEAEVPRTGSTVPESSAVPENAGTIQPLSSPLPAHDQWEEPDEARSAAATPAKTDEQPTLISDDDIFLFNEGTHYRLYDKLGAHPMSWKGEEGTLFAVWAPNARSVSVIGDFNGWDKDAWYLNPRGSSGIWEGFIKGVGPGAHYKYHIRSGARDFSVDKADPFGFMHESPPRTGSVVTTLEYDWGDEEWMRTRGARIALDKPVSIYEMHLGSWMRSPEEGERPLTYRELAPRLAEYLLEMRFTHVEFLPLMEHPFYGSWGYQTTGYFAPTSRYGTPQDLMYLIDYLHQNGIGVILDWVPSHYPSDEHGLAYFDGTHLFEHEDPRQGFHPDWESHIFNYGRNEVRSFLASSAAFWIERFHADGLRVDAVASMLYLDYSRKEGEWIPNRYGGRENIDAIEFLRRLNSDLYRAHPDIQTIAEESTAWPMVSRPTYLGGLGFGMKWDMGWMHDTLTYMAKDPIFRSHHHNALTFRLIYAYTENFVLPLSHDEVVHGKGSLLNKMPGDDWQKFANLRLLYSYMWAQPGKKLLFMGGEIAQWAEWNHEKSLDWHLLEYPLHEGTRRLVADLNRVYRDTPALHEIENDAAGFDWIDANDSAQSVISFLRRDSEGNEVIAVFNFTPMARRNYLIGASKSGYWREIFNSDATEYGGSGVGNMGRVETAPVPYHGRADALNITVPPLGAVFFVHEE
jgi:1,4-alpha-glucan branching enzyme